MQQNILDVFFIRFVINSVIFRSQTIFEGGICKIAKNKIKNHKTSREKYCILNMFRFDGIEP